MPANESANEQVLRDVAAIAVAAPSIFNTQPWCWQADANRLRLWADHGRRLMVADPTGRLLTISCGVALHHARLALAALGHDVVVERLPDPAEPDLLATISLGSGEALSAALLTATAHGLGTAPMSDVTELTVTREQLRHLLAGVGVPQLAVRVGHAPPGDPPMTPRRPCTEVIHPRREARHV